MSIDITSPAIESVSSRCGYVAQRTHVDVQQLAWFSAVDEPSEWQSIRIDGPGWLGNDGRARVEYGSLGRLDEAI